MMSLMLWLAELAHRVFSLQLNLPSHRIHYFSNILILGRVKKSEPAQIVSINIHDSEINEGALKALKGQTGFFFAHSINCFSKV